MHDAEEMFPAQGQVHQPRWIGAPQKDRPAQPNFRQIRLSTDDAFALFMLAS